MTIANKQYVTKLFDYVELVMFEDITRHVNLARDHLGIRINIPADPPTLEDIPLGAVGDFLGRLLGGCIAMGWYEGSWHQVHHTLLTHCLPVDLVDFARLGLGVRWLRAERLILEDPEAAYSYALCVIQGRWVEAEKLFLKDDNHKYAVQYAINVLKRRWHEYELRRDTMSSAWARYVDHFNLYKDN